MVVEEQTKKEQIINLAQNDPFLKISDIAAYVKTTPRYVRTILSEANISLMKLRKRYARSMERQLRLQEEERKEAHLSMVDGADYLHRGEMEMQLVQNNLEQDIAGESLYRISQVSFFQERPYSLHEIIVGEAYLEKECLADRDTIYQLLKIPGDLDFHPSTIHMKEARSPWTEDLFLADGDMVIVVTRNIGPLDALVAREQFILDARILESIIPGRRVV